MSKDFVIFVVNSINNNFMHSIRYEIGLNEQGRPCIELPEDYEQRPEDRFFALEITRYMLQDLLARRTLELDKQTVDAMDEAERLLGQLGDDVAAILWNMMKSHGEMKMMLDGTYHIKVNSIEERDALSRFNILYNDMVFKRVEGLKVAIFTTLESGELHVDRYELVDGITNEHWVKL